MATATEIQHVKASRKGHQCSWCGETIEAKQSYSRYRWYDRGDASTAKLHPECLEALDAASAETREVVEFSPVGGLRGCHCAFDCECGRY